ncbi:hypothetical protein ABZP36_012577 [Zizania latifolia]
MSSHHDAIGSGLGLLFDVAAGRWWRDCGCRPMMRECKRGWRKTAEECQSGAVPEPQGQRNVDLEREVATLRAKTAEEVEERNPASESSTSKVRSGPRQRQRHPQRNPLM